jgi:3-oxoadipate enol-lactonase
MPFCETRGVRIHYEVQGQGEPLVLIHANPFDRRLWMFQAARYSAFYKVINIDLRSYGHSQTVLTRYSLPDLKDDVLAVLAQEGVTSAIFMGVSVGSGLCLLMGLDHPDMTKAIVPVGGSASGPENVERITSQIHQETLAQDIMRLMVSYTAPGFAETPKGRWLLNQFIDRADRMSAEGISNVFRARAGFDMAPRLPQMRVPTLVVNGEFDGSLERGKITASIVPGARHAVIKGTGHACVIEDPVGFDAAVVPFLRDLGLWRGP